MRNPPSSLHPERVEGAAPPRVCSAFEKRSPAAALLAALLLAACSTLPPRIGDPGPEVTDSHQESQYEDLLHHFSAHAELYGSFDTRLFSEATYQSWLFRQARVERMGSFQAQPQEVVQAHLQQEKQQFDQAIDFWLGVHVNDPRFDDFDRVNSIWRIELVTPAGEVTPTSVERIGRADLNMRAYYPYMGDFWVAYRVRFPKALPDGTPLIGPGTEKLLVRLASTLGTAEFKIPAQ